MPRWNSDVISSTLAESECKAILVVLSHGRTGAGESPTDGETPHGCLAPVEGESEILKNLKLAVALAASVGFLAACSDNQGINAVTGGLVGAAAGQAVGGGSGRTAATLVGTAVGAQIGATQPTGQQQRLCTYRNPQTGGTYQAACP